MSKIIASAAIRGAHKIAKQAEDILAKAVKEKGKDCRVEFPNTGYYLPIIYSMTGIAVEKLSDFEEVMKEIKGLLSANPFCHQDTKSQRNQIYKKTSSLGAFVAKNEDDELWLPYLGPTLDAGMAALFAEEIIEACKYLIGPNPVDGIWLGAADDVILRERGIQFVDGTAPGFAAIVGAAPDVETAVNIARKLQERCLYVFMSGQTRTDTDGNTDYNGITFAEQLVEGGVQLGWETRLVPFGKDITSAIYALGFASRAAMSFGGVQPGDYRRNLLYNKNRIFAFVMALGKVTDEWYATAAGAINYGFPTIADSDIPEILPTGVCTYEHVVSNIPHDRIVEKAIEVRGLKIKVAEIDIPVAHSPAFEGERIRKEDMHCEFGGQRTPALEWLRMLDIGEVEDGKVEVNPVRKITSGGQATKETISNGVKGPDIDSIKAGGKMPLAVVVEVAGRKMQIDFEPVLERQIHSFMNEAQGLWHMGQRDTIWVRISKDARQRGFKLEHIGKLLHALFHDRYSNILDKVQVKIFTDEKQVLKLREQATKVYAERDARLAGMADEDIETFYSCTLCQSFAPNHLCVISPERPGLCGAYSWLDCRAAYEITPTGPNQPISKGNCIEPTIGQWDKINAFVLKTSGGNVQRMSQYSMIIDPMTSCGCFECIAAVLPSTGGIMIVNREFSEMTPCGMKFSTLAGTVGGGQQTPGFIGHSKHYINSKKFIAAEGGIKRIVWMPAMLKEEIKESFIKRAEELGLGGQEFLAKIADENTANTEEEVLEFITKANHPATTMEPMF